ncbi:MAG: hypothetical protein CM1200mP2_42320 [Planctomycetaceae bacterium]|nr:MAG: hypothetical protein CM1200mP2_42320 [Planctomycetaceae bacterium]
MTILLMSGPQSNYRSMAEFFGHLGSKEGPIDAYGREIRRFVKPESRVPWKAGERVELTHLDGSRVRVPVASDRRDALVDWMFGPGQAADGAGDRQSRLGSDAGPWDRAPGRRHAFQ